MKEQRFTAGDEGVLEEVARQVLAAWPHHRIFLFRGELGAGKTTLIQRFCRQLQVTDTVQSPTFALVNVYATADGDEVYHLDLYRIEQPAEALDIGLTEYLDSGRYCFIEWPEKAGFVPGEAVEVLIEVAPDGTREIVVREAEATV